MSAPAIVSVSNLDVNKVTFGDVKISKNNGSKSVAIKYSDQLLQIRIPKMRYSMGASIKETENGTTYTMMASLLGCDSYAKERAPTEAGEVGQLYNFLQDLQEKMIRSATENSVKWFGRARKEDVLRDSMKSFMNPSVEKQGAEWVPNGKYPPSFRMKIPVYDGKVSMDVVDNQRRPVGVTPSNLAEIFPKRVEANFVVSPSIYISGQGFGVTWRIIYAQVLPTQRMTAAQIFDAIDDGEDETEAVATLPTEQVFGEETQQEVHQEPVQPTTSAPPKNRRRQVAPL